MRRDLAGMIMMAYLTYGRSASGTNPIGPTGRGARKLNSLQRLGRQRSLILRLVLERAGIAWTREAASTMRSSTSSFSAAMVPSSIAGYSYVYEVKRKTRKRTTRFGGFIGPIVNHVD